MCLSISIYRSIYGSISIYPSIYIYRSIYTSFRSGPSRTAMGGVLRPALAEVAPMLAWRLHQGWHGFGLKWAEVWTKFGRASANLDALRPQLRWIRPKLNRVGKNQGRFDTSRMYLINVDAVSTKLAPSRPKYGWCPPTLGGSAKFEMASTKYETL